MHTNVVVDFEQDALFRTLLSTAVDGIIVIDAKGMVRVFNSACETLFGYRPEEVLGRNVKLLMPQPYRDEHDGYLKNYQEGAAPKVIGIGREVVGRRKDGSEFPMYLSVGEGVLGAQKVFVGIIRDLTAIKGADQKREEATRLLAQIVESSDDAILSKTLAGVITSWNGAAQKIFGYDASEVVGKHISILIPPERLAEEDHIIAQLKAGRDIHHYETVRRHKIGQDVIVSLSVSPIRDSSGHVIGAAKIARDITEKTRSDSRAKMLQAELEHAARLNVMGQMTAAIAHEVNQPLTAVTNYVNAAKQTFARVLGVEEQASARINEYLEKAADQALRAGGIIRNLRDFIEKRENNRAVAQLNTVVEEAVALAFMSGADSDVKLTLDLASDLPPVMIDRIQVQQVIVNLVRNSIEAMATGNRRKLTISTGTTEDGHVQLVVADNGPGLSPEVSERLFQPFVTTKSKGMGMGLSICQTIIEGHGGGIRLLTDIAGAAFEIRLPVLENDENPL